MDDIPWLLRGEDHNDVRCEIAQREGGATWSLEKQGTEACATTASCWNACTIRAMSPATSSSLFPENSPTDLGHLPSGASCPCMQADETREVRADDGCAISIDPRNAAMRSRTDCRRDHMGGQHSGLMGAVCACARTLLKRHVTDMTWYLPLLW